MPGTINCSKNDQILLSAEKVKVTTNNILGFEQDKTVSEAFPDIKIMREKSLLYMLGIIIAALHLADSLFYLFVPYSHHFFKLRSQRYKISYLGIHFSCFI